LKPGIPTKKDRYYYQDPQAGADEPK